LPKPQPKQRSKQLQLRPHCPRSGKFHLELKLYPLRALEGRKSLQFKLIRHHTAAIRQTSDMPPGMLPEAYGGGLRCCQQVRRPLHQRMPPRNAASSGGLSRKPRRPSTATRAPGIPTRVTTRPVRCLSHHSTVTIRYVFRYCVNRCANPRLRGPHTCPSLRRHAASDSNSARFCAMPCYEDWVADGERVDGKPWQRVDAVCCRYLHVAQLTYLCSLLL